jgi:hypothetical protein
MNLAFHLKRALKFGRSTQHEFMVAATAQDPRLLDGAGGILIPLESDADQQSALALQQVVNIIERD